MRDADGKNLRYADHAITGSEELTKLCWFAEPLTKSVPAQDTEEIIVIRTYCPIQTGAMLMILPDPNPNRGAKI